MSGGVRVRQMTTNGEVPKCTRLLLSLQNAVAHRRGASARLVLCYASRERKVQRVGLELAVAHYFSWLALDLPSRAGPVFPS
jgi:hypothetical protein